MVGNGHRNHITQSSRDRGGMSVYRAFSQGQEKEQVLFNLNSYWMCITWVEGTGSIGREEPP